MTSSLLNLKINSHSRDLELKKTEQAISISFEKKIITKQSFFYNQLKITNCAKIFSFIVH